VGGGVSLGDRRLEALTGGASFGDSVIADDEREAVTPSVVGGGDGGVHGVGALAVGLGRMASGVGLASRRGLFVAARRRRRCATSVSTCAFSTMAWLPVAMALISANERVVSSSMSATVRSVLRAVSSCATKAAFRPRV
jgi:hypothetical protein